MAEKFGVEPALRVASYAAERTHPYIVGFSMAGDEENYPADDYVDALEGEVRKYVVDHPNFGKAAKRMYNIFRLTGRYAEAAYIRELFDEPATVLYQVWSLITTLDNAAGRGFSRTITRSRVAAAKYTSPTGFSGDPPPAPRPRDSTSRRTDSAP